MDDDAVLPDDDRVVIEVAVNGVTRKDRNPTAPETPDEVAADALACLEAGASVVHTHPLRSFAERHGPADTAEEYAQAYRQVLAERPDAILYPTMSGGTTIAERYDHHRHLAAEGLIRCGALDSGSVNLASFGVDGLPTDTDFVYTNSPADIRSMMATCAELGIGPSIAVYEPGFLRMVLGFHQHGTLPAGTLVKFYFSGDDGFFGSGLPTYSAPPIREAFALYRAMLGDADLPWAVTVLGGDLLSTPVADLALAQGGHLRVGLEDHPGAESNVVQVERAVEAAARHGRRPATCTEAAKILRLP